MHSIISRKKRFRFEEDEKYDYMPEHPRHSHATWAAIAVGGAALIGAGASIYGANKQAKSNQAAQEQNAEAQDKQNAAAWANWLMTRGVAPTSPTAAGQMPSSYSAVNTRLPLWATISQNKPSAGTPFLVKKGSAVAAPTYKLGAAPQFAPAGSASADTSASNGSKSPGTGQKLANLLDPLNVSVGKNKNFLDPLGIFG